MATENSQQVEINVHALDNEANSNTGKEQIVKNGKRSVDTEGNQNENDREEQIKKDWDHLLCVLPEVVWRILFEVMVENSDDFELVINASPLWRYRLLDQRTFMLFPKVFPNLEGKLHETFDFGNHFNAHQPVTTHCELCRRLRRAKPFSGILQLRLTCKAWNNIIDNYCRCGPVLFEKTSVRNVQWSHDFHDTNANDATGGLALAQFVQHFNVSHPNDEVNTRSPFIGNGIALQFTPWDMLDDANHINYNNNALALLTQHGHHVQTCELSFDYASSLLRVYQQLRELLLRMPALKQLYLSVTNTNVDWLHDELREYPEVEVNALNQYIIENGLPTLEKLEYLVEHEHEGRGSCPYIFDELLLKNRHIGQLKLKYVPLQQLTFWHNTSLPHLRKLSFTFLQPSDVLVLEAATIQCPVEELKLNFDAALIQRAFWRRVVAVLEEKFGETLIDLYILVYCCDNPFLKKESREQPLPESFNFTRLQRLEIYVPDDWCLDFVLCTKDTLTCLDMWTRENEYNESRALAVKSSDMTYLIDLYRCWGRPLDSNIWELLPSLQTLRLFRFGRPQGTKRKVLWEHRRSDWKAKTRLATKQHV